MKNIGLEEAEVELPAGSLPLILLSARTRLATLYLNQSNNCFWKMSMEKMNIQEFLKRHLRASSYANERSVNYTPEELIEVVKRAMELFRKEPSLARMSPPCIVVGDIHGQYLDLIRILNAKNDDKMALSSKRFMFLGDYVDRGRRSVECITLMFTLKIMYPTHYVLLRGNHESKAINHAYGFKDELCDKFGEAEGLKVWELYNEAFALMPLAGIIGSKILCMHGGISKHLTCLEDIEKIKRPIMEVAECPLAIDLMWADPIDTFNGGSLDPTPRYVENTLRGLACMFNEAAVKEMCLRLKIELIVRAHQMMEYGFKFYAERKLVTIFSAPRYLNETENKGAILKVSKSGSVSLVLLKPRAEEKATAGSDEKTKFLTEVPNGKKSRKLSLRSAPRV
ncbi:unnamed protein product [Caenorhabditis auriculariae]|uniref:Serine/threonine-protein phosphatase n=1 Tax=Caenorhabditis auriculariae TaxID=2777116 RepID=A0A8S1GTY7_9PELO|nr:unnamed protein product [Caenorhabditis auriculariae]